MSYKDALQRQIQSRPTESGSALGNSATTQKDPLSRLKASLCSIMRKHPEGVALAQVRRSCPLLHDPGVLEGFASSKHLLASLTEVLATERNIIDNYVNSNIINHGDVIVIGRARSGCCVALSAAVPR
ncbi:hypothetical protein AAFF_G00330890 [Aldrovandia affinis]|uniref:Uncharacterized protein n=1 Tax=Aldrovandia affinis TaxID=143900 RepID=A0AAD7R6S1_9TELE|nr:hypothetical protein AAFF_G00330890 [Aldrovandia affinis]